jgi:hypothetical protein
VQFLLLLLSTPSGGSLRTRTVSHPQIYVMNPQYPLSILLPDNTPCPKALKTDLALSLQIPPLLQLRTHRQTYRTCSIGEDVNFYGTEDMMPLSGRAQGYFTRTGLEGWGTWEASRCSARFDGQWHAGKRGQGIWKPDRFRSYKGLFVNDRFHGEVLYLYAPSGCVFTYVYDMGRVVSRENEGVWEG